MTGPALGITGYGGYIPRMRIDRTAIADAHKWMAPGLRSLSKGFRTCPAWDEDVLTMAVEAGRDALLGNARQQLHALHVASTNFPFADFQNATLVAGALNLPTSVRTVDMGQSQRAATSGVLAALTSTSGPLLFIASDMPRAKPASPQELSYGAGAAAVTLGDEGVVATLMSSASISLPFVDHFRSSTAHYDQYWEDRWIRDEGYLKFVPEIIRQALEKAKLGADTIDHFVLGSPMAGIASAIAQAAGIRATAVADPLAARCGYAGAAHSLMMLVHTLEKAGPGEIVLWVGFGQGCDALVFRTTDAIKASCQKRGISGSLEDAIVQQDYLRMLAHRGEIDVEWGMRSERPIKTAFSDQYRSRHQLLEFAAGKCEACGTVQFPQLAYCVNPECCAQLAGCEQLSLSDEPAHVASFTTDWLAYHPDPPLVTSHVQFKNGAKLLMEVADVDAASISVGMPLRMVFRIKDVDKIRGWSRYFWKATPIAGAEGRIENGTGNQG